ncbi:MULTISPECIES: ATP-binding protein [unclassified Microcoleus]|uniref:GAF domain-containing sensor histidine kinase n=1 Tax=unclassified Microcoleus TaxID=2642155 RepID=UPI002FD0E5C3
MNFPQNIDGLDATSLVSVPKYIQRTEFIATALKSLALNTATLTGEDFFASLATNLALTLNVPHVFISELIGDRLHTLAIWTNNELQQNITFDPKPTPCGILLHSDKTIYHCPCQLQSLFPDDRSLVELKAESYLGAALQDATGKYIGTICLIDNEPMIEPELYEDILKIFAARASMEIERMRTTEKIQQLYLENIKSFIDEQEKSQQLNELVQQLQSTQLQLVHTEKISQLGQLVAGIAHEVNNPISFISGNLFHLNQYFREIVKHLSLYQQYFPKPNTEIFSHSEEIDLEILLKDTPNMIESMKLGIDRISDIMNSLRNYSRIENKGKGKIDIHEGIDTTLIILSHRLKANHLRPAIQVVKEYGELPLVECYVGQINQVFMNLLANAIDALEESNQGKSYTELETNPNTITICTSLNSNQVTVRIVDNGVGMTEEVRQKLFSPFFTTKPEGKGTGLGLSISCQIMTEQHSGNLQCFSTPGKGAEFVMEIPLNKLY